MSEYRNVMVSNQLLFRLADSKKLQQLLHVRRLVPKLHWMPPGLKQVKDLGVVLSSWQEDFCQEFADENRVLEIASN